MKERDSPALLVDLQNCAAIMKNGMKIPQIPKNKLPYSLAIPLLCIYLNKLKTLIQKDLCILTFTEAIYNSQTMELWKQFYMSFNRGKDKEDVIYIYIYICVYIYTHIYTIHTHNCNKYILYVVICVHITHVYTV